MLISENEFMLISESEFTHEVKNGGITSFMDFMNAPPAKIKYSNLCNKKPGDSSACLIKKIGGVLYKCQVLLKSSSSYKLFHGITTSQLSLG